MNGELKVTRRPGRPVGQSDDLTDTELRQLIALPDRRTREGLRDYVVLLLLVNTPMRKGELVSLKVANLLDEGEFTYVTYQGLKKRKRRNKVTGEVEEKQRPYWLKIPVGRGVFDSIWRYVRQENRGTKISGEAPLIQTLGKFGPYEKRGITPDAVDLIVAKYVKAAGIRRRITPHSFRATYLTMRAAGRDPATLLGLSGHADLRGILPYIRSSEEKRREAALSHQYE